MSKHYVYVLPDGRVARTAFPPEVTLTPREIRARLDRTVFELSRPKGADGRILDRRAHFDVTRDCCPPDMTIVEVEEGELPARETRADWKIENGKLVVRPVGDLSVKRGVGREVPQDV